MSTVTSALFTWPLGDDVVLIPRTVAMTEAHFALVEANYGRLRHWFPDAYQEPPTLEDSRTSMERAGQGWLDGWVLPLFLAVKAEGGWRLVGWVNLEIDVPARSAEVGYWLDADFVGRGSGHPGRDGCARLRVRATRPGSCRVAERSPTTPAVAT